MRKQAILQAMIVVAVSSSPVLAQESGDPRILSLVPNQSHACVAGLLTLAPGDALAGVRWHNNDSAAPFARLLLLEGQPGVPPNLAGTGVVVEGPGGDTSSWAEAMLAQPVVSTTRAIYAVLVFPSGEETNAVGAGGGPGIGVCRGAPGVPFFISADGSDWISFNPESQLMLEPVLQSTLGKAVRPAAVLSSLAGQVNYRGMAEAAAGLVRLPEFSGIETVVPNPFNPVTELRYALARPCEAKLAIYNLRGQLVKTLADGEQPAGRYSVTWRGQDERGGNVASGVYFARLATCDGKYSRRLTLLR